jgi:hypothetical protein
VRVRRNEGVAIHVGPEPCAGTREDTGEASAGERTGQPLSRESDKSQGADTVTYVEGNTVGHVSASVRSALRGLRAAKPANKSEGSEAESVERREGPRGTRTGTACAGHRAG